MKMKIRNEFYKMVAVAVICLAGTARAAAQDSLVTYIAVAIRNNPAVIGAYQAYRAQVEAAAGAGILADPELTVGVYPSPMENVNVKQLATFTVMQMFPWFGSLKADREQMTYKVESVYQKFRADGIALAYQMQQQWYDMLAVQEKIRSVEDKLQLLKEIERVSLVQYKSPAMAMKAKMSDQFRLQAEEAKLEEQIASLRDQLRLQQDRFNLTMHRKVGTPLVIPDSITLREMPLIAWEDVERNDPTLNRLQADAKSYVLQGEKAKLMGRPMFGVGLQYMLNGTVMTPHMADMNGKDMLMPMLKMTIPVYRKKINAARRSADLMRQSTEFGYQRQQDALTEQYLSITQRAADVKRKIDLYDREVGILNHTLQLMTAEYANGSSSLTDILQTTREQIDYALKKAEAYAQYNTIVAEYEKLASRYDYAQRSQTLRKQQTDKK